MLGPYIVTGYLLIGFIYAKYASWLMEKWHAKNEAEGQEWRSSAFEVAVLFFWPTFVYSDIKARLVVRKWVKEHEAKDKLGVTEKEEE